MESNQWKEGRLLPSTVVIHALCGTESHLLKLFKLKVEDKIILLLTRKVLLSQYSSVYRLLFIDTYNVISTCPDSYCYLSLHTCVLIAEGWVIMCNHTMKDLKK